MKPSPKMTCDWDTQWHVTVTKHGQSPQAWPGTHTTAAIACAVERMINQFARNGAKCECHMHDGHPEGTIDDWLQTMAAFAGMFELTIDMQPVAADAESMFTRKRWPNGVRCVHCDSSDIQHIATRKPQPYRCRTCRKCFSVSTRWFMHGTNLTLDKWATAYEVAASDQSPNTATAIARAIGCRAATAKRMLDRLGGILETERRSA